MALGRVGADPDPQFVEQQAMRVRRTRLSGREGQAGFSLLEGAISLSVFAVLMGGYMITMSRMSESTDASALEHELLVDCGRVMSAITSDLRRSGYENVDGIDMPVFFDAGDPPAAFAEFGHDVPHDPFGDGLTREIVFSLPEDADGDGWPDLEADRSGPVWSDDYVAYQLVPELDGTNSLRRLTSAGDATTLSRNVTQLIFESPADTGFLIPADTLRVTLVLRRAARNGAVRRIQIQEVVQLFNGWIAP